MWRGGLNAISIHFPKQKWIQKKLRLQPKKQVGHEFLAAEERRSGKFRFQNGEVSPHITSFTKNGGGCSDSGEMESASIIYAPFSKLHQDKSRWHSYHVLFYISPVLTYLLGTVCHVLWPWCISRHPKTNKWPWKNNMSTHSFEDKFHIWNLFHGNIPGSHVSLLDGTLQFQVTFIQFIHVNVGFGQNFDFKRNELLWFQHDFTHHRFVDVILLMFGIRYYRL